MDHERRLWEYRWVRDLTYVVLVVAALWVVYEARAVTLPALIGLVLAYAFDPLVSWARRKLTLPRWMSTLLLMLAVLVVTASVLLYILPGLLVQKDELMRRLPGYEKDLLNRIEAHLPKVDGLAPGGQAATSQPMHPDFGGTESIGPMATTQPATVTSGGGTSQGGRYGLGKLENVDVSAVAAYVMDWLGTGLGLVRTTITATAYLALAATLVLVCFFYFSWKFDGIKAWMGQFIPAGGRDGTVRVIGKMDRAVSAFFRGRIIQAMLVGGELTIGWWLAGVPYWLLLGMIGGVLHMIPYGAIAVWPVAVALTWVSSAGSAAFSWWHVLFWPSVVYLVAQGLDGWLLEPMVQGKATDLDPLSVMLAVLIGGTLGGVLGMMVAVPTAACVKILAREVVLPRLRRHLGTQEA